MYGSHSAPLMITHLIWSRFLTVSLTTVGKPAPPKPTRPLARTASRKSCMVSSFGGAMPSQRASSPSDSISTVCIIRPFEPSISPIFFTVPETLA